MATHHRQTSSSGDASLEILSSMDALSLMRDGLAGPPSSTTGTRQIHRRRLNRSSEEECAELPLNTNPRVRPDAFVTIPEALISKATIECLGFTPARANYVWQRWVNLQASRSQASTSDQFDVSFLDYVKGSINTSKDAWDEDDKQWTSCMNHWGVNQELQEAILDKRFKSIRLTRSCIDWLRESIEGRYYGLVDIQETSRQRATGLQHGASRSGRSDSTSGGGGAPGSSTGPLAPPGGSARARGLSESQQGLIGQPTMEQYVTPSDLAAERAPGWVVLYKAIFTYRIENRFSTPDGKLKDIRCIVSQPPGDFSGGKTMFYFGTSIEVAECYAGYLKKRTGVYDTRVSIIRLRIPNSAVETLSNTQLAKVYFPSDEWKKLVWFSRNDETTPSELNRFKTAILIIGTIAGRDNKVYEALDNWTQIERKHILVPPRPIGRDPIQYVFSNHSDSGPCGRDFLKANIHGIRTGLYQRKNFLQLMADLENEVNSD